MERMHQHHREAIGRFYPICAQTPAARRATVESGEIHELAPGSFLFDKGDLDSRALYLLEGHVDLLRNSQLIETVRGGSEAARHALEQATPRRLTAVTRTRAVVFAVDATLLGPHDGEKQAGSDVNVEVADIVENRDGDWMTRLLQTTLLARLPVDNIQQLFSRMQALPFAGGEVVVRQGERCDHYHVVQEGRCVVTRHPAGDEGSVIRLAELGAGDGFGEEGLVSGGTCVATVTMVTDGIVMRLGKDDFDVLVKQPCTVAVGQAQALARVAAGARWLDVRRTRDPAAELPGSIHVPMGTLRMRVHRRVPARPARSGCVLPGQRARHAARARPRGLGAHVARAA
jgi:CRP-like cAMP-binding protein